MSTTKPQTEFSIQSDDVISISRKKIFRSRNMPEYVRCGIPESGRDLIDVLTELSKPAIHMFQHIKQRRDLTCNLVTLDKPATPTEINKQNLALKELMNADLLKRVKTSELKAVDGQILTVPKRTFIINPMYLFPRSNDDFETSYDYWNQLGE